MMMIIIIIIINIIDINFDFVALSDNLFAFS